MKRKYLIMGCLLASLTWSSARTWTSAEGDQTFEGEFKAYDESTGNVTVLSKGTEIVFKQDKLSEKDKTYIQELENEKKEVESASNKVGKAMTEEVLSRLDGDKFESVSMEKTPEYYLLYFSASW